MKPRRWISLYQRTIFVGTSGRPRASAGSTEDIGGDKRLPRFHEPSLATDERFGSLSLVPLLLTFLLGIGNFAMHKAVLESRHPMLERMPWAVRLFGGPISLWTEFLLLLGALLLVANGQPGWGWAYLVYSGLNTVAAWLILSRRI